MATCRGRGHDHPTRRALSRPHPPCCNWPRRLLVWLLLCALPVYGSSGVLQQLLGPQHRHVQAAPAAAPGDSGLGPALQAWIGPGLATLLQTVRTQRLLLQSVAEPHQHRHGLFERHHHHASDDSVIALGDAHGPGDAASEGGSGSGAGALLAIGPLAANPALAAGPRAGPWPRSVAQRWRSRGVDRLERPPRAG